MEGLHWQPHGEPAAVAEFALQTHLPAEEPTELAHDRQPQTGARKFAGHRIVAGLKHPALPEFLEDCLLLLRSDSHAGVDHIEHQIPPRAGGGRPKASLHRNPAATGGEFHGIGEQIGQDLLHLGLILLNGIKPRADVKGELDVFLFGQRPHHVALSRHNRFHVKQDRADLHFASLNLRQIEDVVDHFQEHASGGADVLHIAALLVIERLDRSQNIRKADDAVEGCAELMAHRRQEVALEPVHLVEIEIGPGEFIDFIIEAAVGLAQIFLGIDQPAQHPVEGHPQFLEFIGSVDLGPRLHIPAPHLVAHIAQMLQRLDDHVAHDRIGGQPGQEGRHDGGGHQDRPIPVDCLLRRLVGHHHLNHRHQIPLAELHWSVANGRGGTGGAAELMADQTALAGPNRLVVVVFGFIGGAKLAVFARQRRWSHRRCARGHGRDWPLLEIIEHCGIEPGVSGAVGSRGLGIEQPPAVGLALQRAAERHDQAGVFLVGFQRLPVVMQHDRIDQMATGAAGGGVNQLLGAAAIPPEAATDQHEQTEPEQEAAFPLQARLSQNVGDGTV